MKHLTSVIFRLTLVLTLFGGVIAPSSQPVLAQSVILPEYSGLGYKWSLGFDYEKDLNGVVTVEVGRFEEGDLVEVLDVYDYLVLCQPQGTVTVQDGKATFASQSFITCEFELTTYLQEVADIHGFVIENGLIYPDWTMDAWGIQLNIPSISTVPASITLFNHPSVRQNLTIHSATSHQSAVTLSTQFGPVSITSQPFLLQNLAATELDLSAYNDFCPVSGPSNDCKMIYSVIPASPKVQIFPGSPVPFTMADTVISIGQPVNFSWSVDGFYFDPKAWKQGG